MAFSSMVPVLTPPVFVASASPLTELVLVVFRLRYVIFIVWFAEPLPPLFSLALLWSYAAWVCLLLPSLRARLSSPPVLVLMSLFFSSWTTMRFRPPRYSLAPTLSSLVFFLHVRLLSLRTPWPYFPPASLASFRAGEEPTPSLSLLFLPALRVDRSRLFPPLPLLSPTPCPSNTSRKFAKYRYSTSSYEV